MTELTSDHSLEIPPCVDCDSQAERRLIEMFVEIAQKRRIQLGQMPAERPVFRKLHGVAYARLEPYADLAEEMRVVS